MKIIYLLMSVATSVVLLSGTALTGCKREAVERTTVELQDDEKLTDQVKAALEKSPAFKFPDVQVTSFKAKVQLSGFVLTDEQKRSAETIAKGVPGVVAVENRISLKQ